jgi:Leucine-rich repeat (LRR) protein
LSSITPAANSRPSNSGSSSMRPPHSVLQTLSLTNNQLTSICSGLSGPSSSSSVVSGAGQAGGNNGWRVAGWRDQGLSLWLPGLQTLLLSGNQLPDLNGLQGCSNLRVLDVSRNHLTDVQVRACPAFRPREWKHAQLC